MAETENPSNFIPGVHRGVILVVDDNPESRGTLRACLDEQGFYPLIAKDGENAVDLAVQNHPVVILLDTQLSGLGGYETCRRLKIRRGYSRYSGYFCGQPGG